MSINMNINMGGCHRLCFIFHVEEEHIPVVFIRINMSVSETIVVDMEEKRNRHKYNKGESHPKQQNKQQVVSNGAKSGNQ